MVFPERLREGDTVGLAAPAFPVKEEERDGCVKLLEGMGYRAAEDIIQMIDKGKPGDLFISVISGGSSALLTCPKEGITLQETQSPD